MNLVTQYITTTQIKTSLYFLLGMLISQTALAEYSSQYNTHDQQQLQVETPQQTFREPSIFEIRTTHEQNQREQKGIQQQTTDQASISTMNTPSNPCFPIQRILFTSITPIPSKDIYRFQFAIQPELNNKKQIIGQCLNIQDIEQLLSRVQNRIIKRGYITTRVLLSNQNLSSGQLVLTLAVGYIDQVRANTLVSKKAIYVSKTPQLNQQQDLPATFNHALPIKSGKILNLRDLETGLDNLKRVAYVDANFDIQPSTLKQHIGYSDLLIHYSMPKRISSYLSLDDSGSKYTGKYQGAVTLSILNPTQHNDMIYFSYGQDLRHIFKNNEPIDGQRGSKNWNVGYTVPWHRWLFSASSGEYDYHQTVSGINQDYEYSGTSQQHSLTAQYLLHRNAYSKTYLSIGGFNKEQQNFIDDTEIDVQRRKISGWVAGIKYERQMNKTKISTDLTLQRGTGAFNAIMPAESLFNEGFIRTGIVKANVQLNTPFQIKQQQFNYQLNLKGQYAYKPLVPSERISIGGRYSVYGFDGERTLAGDIGAVLRQEIAWTLPKATQDNAHQLYSALDAGWVKMKQQAQDEQLAGHHLIGSAIGIKGQYKKLNYNLFTSYPIYQPKYFYYDVQQQKDVKNWVSGFSMGLSF